MTLYQITWEGDNVEGELFVNDFPVNRFSGALSCGGMSLNPYLVGENEVRVEVRKKNSARPGRLTIGVSAMVQAEIAASDQEGSLLALEIADSELKPATTARRGKGFTTPLDFSYHLRPSGIIGGNQAIEYARTVYDLFKAKKTDDLMREFAVKVADYAAAYPGHDFTTEFRSLLAAMLREKLAPVDFEQVRARKCGPGGKLWQLLEGKRQLIRTAAADGSENEMALFVGLIDGKPRIVR